jgi:hypothetical protein
MLTQMIDTLECAKYVIKICDIFSVVTITFVMFASLRNLHIVIIIYPIFGGCVTCYTV